MKGGEKGGNFLTIDTSVFHIFTSNDPALPRDLVLDPDGKEKFRKYIPAGKSFVNTIEDYPYPYVIGGLCWEFPCVNPSDWQAQFLHKPDNPITVKDWQAALDCTVIKQGVFCLVFHPHNWIKPEQVVDLIDHAVAKHGKKVKFLTFKEAQERLDKNLLAGVPLRDPKTGGDNGVRLLDINNDGFLDVLIQGTKTMKTRLWLPPKPAWTEMESPKLAKGIEGLGHAKSRFGIVRPDGSASIAHQVHSPPMGIDRIWHNVWHFDGKGWIQDDKASKEIQLGQVRPFVDFRLVDLDGDGRCELLGDDRKVYRFSDQGWEPLAFGFPLDDEGWRLHDIDADGKLDVIWSNEKSYGLYLFNDMKTGWSRKLLEGKPGDPGALPLIAAKGQNMGAFFHSKHVWWQNENTSHLPNLVDRRAFADLLKNAPAEEPKAKPPEESHKAIQMRPGFTVELMAQEPQVQDPISFAFGPDGKLWVVEMGDYPLGEDGKYKPGGKVKYLESTKEDGKYDKATVFLDDLPCPTSVLPWRKGVLVSAAPDIFYAEDSDGDGKADKREVLFTGFNPGNPQHRVNSLVWGLDNWVYCANGDSGGKVTYVGPASRERKRPEPVDIRGRDFRIKPDTGEIDLQLGQTQYGRARDDWGNWFGNNNSNPMWHYAIEDHYLRRNPHVAYPDARVHLLGKAGTAPVFPISRTLPRFNDFNTANHFTSACSSMIYRDDLFGPKFAGNAFICEPVHNLVSRLVVTPDGTTFKARRADDEQKTEFLASTDNWFRPVWLQTGPDGALWVADMYRHVIEHPEWIPKQVQAKLDLRAGHDMGRIYRVYPAGAKPRAIPRLDKMTTAELVAALDSPSGWQRDLAQMMLVWKQDMEAERLLRNLVRDSRNPLARLHGLCVLEALGAKSSEPIHRCLGDSDPGVRRHAVRRLAEILADLGPETAVRTLLKLADDPDPDVVLQLAYTLGQWKSPQAGVFLSRIAIRDSGNRFISAAVLSSVNKDNLSELLLAVLKSDQRPAALVENLLRIASALDDQKALVTLLSAVGTPEKEKIAAWQLTALAGLLDALDQRSTSLEKLAEGSAELKDAVAKQAGLFIEARRIVADKKAPPADQLVAIRLLGRGKDSAADLGILTGLLTPQTGDDLQAAAVAQVGRLRDPKVPDALLKGWKTYGPGLRGQVMEVLLRRDDWIKATFDAIEKKELTAFEIDAARRQRLLDHKDPAIRKRAAAAFAGSINPDRQKLVDSYQPVLTLQGDPMRGQQVFAKQCAGCHKLGDSGHAVGPDLAAVGDKSPQGLLVAVLDPNRVVESRYVNYTALTKNGQVFTGVLASETGTSITLLMQEGKTQVILRTDLDELVSTGKSPMPEGIEKEIGHQAMADLVAFVRGALPQARRKEFEGNKPELVKPGPDGALLLTAKNCEIYGTTVIFEKKYGNLGNWYSQDDQAVWTVDVPRAGKYAVWLDWACVETSAGKPFVLESGPVQLGGTVASTGDWDTYKQAQVGEIVLTAGPQRLTFRSGRKISAALIDLRSVKLAPVKE